MKALARVWILYFTAVPLQRWMLGLLALLPVGLLLPGMATLIWGIFLLTVVLPSGVLFRAVSAPRTHRLLPHFRLKVLVATALMLAFLALATLGVLELDPPLAHVDPVLPLLLLLLSCSFWFFFLVSGGIGSLVFIVPLLLVPAGGRGLWHGMLASAGALGIAPLPLAGFVGAALWLVFGVWYLRVPVIGAPFVPRLARRRGERRGVRGSAPQRADAATLGPPITLYLTGRPRLPTLAWALPYLVLMPVFWLGSDSSFARGALLAFPGLLMPMSYFAAWQLARRSRLLWLKRGASRAGLFDLTEKEALRIALLVAVWVSALVLVTIVFRRDAERGRLAWMLGETLSIGIFACYAGLMRVGALGIADLAAAAWPFVSLVIAAWALLGGSIRTEAIAVLVALQLAGAPLVRAWARRRWASIDWLELRPARLPSQGVRPIG